MAKYFTEKNILFLNNSIHSGDIDMEDSDEDVFLD